MSTSEQPDPSRGLRAGLAGRYEIESELGAGGMAIVYRARDAQRDRAVALKVLRPELSAATGIERFEREIRVASRLVHPNILPLLDSGVTGGLLWYTMPLVEGETLRARLDRERQLPLDEALQITAEVAAALGHAHERGIVHRDIKPENILLASGHALVTDFGIARALSDTNDRLTASGLALGTPAYMSPEQSAGERDIDARSDLYALASVAYEMLAGEPPFTGPTVQAVMARRLSQPAPSLRVIRPAIPEGVDAALRRALATTPADRQASTAEFVTALQRKGTGAGASAGIARPRPRRWSLAVSAGVLGVAALLALQLPMWRARPATDGTSVARPRGMADAIRLAVLPFRQIGGDASDRYLADGLTADVASALANLGGVRVIDQASVASLQASAKGAREIGTILRIDALVDGDVQKSGEAIRVRVRLVDPASEEAKWSQAYDHTARDVFQVQSEVARKVAGVLRIQLAERESRTLERPPTTNPDAYDAYLKARAQARARGGLERPAQADSIIASLTQAVRLDSTFARAWALLASTLVSTVFLYDAPASRLDQAERAIAIALGIDSSVANAWKARHDLEWNAVRGWHFAEALSDVRHALALEPSLVEGHNGLGSLYFHYGFTGKAREELEASLSLDPRDGCDDSTRCVGFSRPRVARVLWYEQKFDSALAVYARMPYLGGFVWEKAVVLTGAGRPTEAMAVLDSALAAQGPETADRAAARALALASLGRRDEALVAVRAATLNPASRSHSHHSQFTIACAYARLGDAKEAVAWLRRTAENGMPNYPLFRDDPSLKGLQGVAEYETLMAGLKRQHEANRALVYGDRTM